jgi:hypothetical protein
MEILKKRIGMRSDLRNRRVKSQTKASWKRDVTAKVLSSDKLIQSLAYSRLGIEGAEALNIMALIAVARDRIVKTRETWYGNDDPRSWISRWISPWIDYT